MLMIFDFLQESFWSLLLVLYLFSISIDELSMLGKEFLTEVVKGALFLWITSKL